LKKRLLFLLITGVILISLVPLFRRDFFHLHDFSHVTRLVELDKALKDGHFPARWSKDLGWGYGMPLFQFYAPLPYFIAELFHLLGFSFITSIKICFGLTSFISFLGMFLLAKKFWGLQGAILAGLAFVYSPYRAVDFYVRGALGELYAISMIPWVLWGITEILDYNVTRPADYKLRRKISLTALLLGLFFLSHTVLNLICFPLFLFFSLFYTAFAETPADSAGRWRTLTVRNVFASAYENSKNLATAVFRPQSFHLLINRLLRGPFFRLLITFLLGIGLTAFFLVPAFFEKKFASVDKLISGYSHYSHHFLYFRQFVWGNWGYAGSVDGIEDGMSFHLGKGHLFLAMLTLILSLIYLKKRRKVEKKILLVIFFVVLALFLAFLSTYRAKPIWDAVPLMAFIQFPWRFNSFIIVLVGFLCGGVGFYLKKLCRKIAYIFTFFAVTLVLIINVDYFRPERYVNPQDNYYTDEGLIREAMSGVIPDYLPIWVKEQPPVAKTDYQIFEGEPQIKVLESKTQKLTLKVENSSFSQVQLNRFYFPGWQVFIDGRKADFEYVKYNGIITLNLPPGSYLLKLLFKNTPIRTFANTASIISLFVVIFLFFGFKKTKVKNI